MLYLTIYIEFSLSVKKKLLHKSENNPENRCIFETMQSL